MVAVTEEESFIIQAHALLECLVKLGDLEIAKSPILYNNYESIFGQTAKLLHNHGIVVFKGQGVLLYTFFVMLVLPLEWGRRDSGDLGKLDLSDAVRVATETRALIRDTYHSIGTEAPTPTALDHFRNALAHGRLGWSNGSLVITDVDRRNGFQYEAQYSMDDLGRIAQSLNLAFANYVEGVLKKRT